MSSPIPIIILNWNGFTDTRECIGSLEQQTYQNYLIYLVDNGSKTPEPEQIRRTYGDHSKIKLYLNKENLGFTLGNNTILRELLSQKDPPPFVILLNNDTEVSPDWLAQLVYTAELKKADMVSSKMVNYYDRTRMDNAGHQLLNTLEVLPLGHDEPVTDFMESVENVGPCAGAALYSTAMLREIGIFDEHFRNGYEDVELGLRAVVCGYRSVFAPEAVVYHKISRSINKIRNLDYTLRIQQHIYYIIAKLVPTGALIACFPFLLFRTLAALVINLVFARWKFLRVQLYALRWVFGAGRKILLDSRRRFFREHQTISAWKLLRRMDLFLKKDIQRFYKYLIRQEKMVFEKYD